MCAREKVGGGIFARGVMELKTIDDFLTIIKTDEDLVTIINNSEHIHKDYKPRWIKRRGMKRLKSPSSYALEQFWNSQDKFKFILFFEKKYSFKTASTIEISKLKTALHLYIVEVLET